MSQKPRCIIVTGRPGSGKTTLSKELGKRLWMPVVSRDELKEGYVNTFGVSHDQLPPETNAIVTDLFFSIVSQYLAGQISVVIEAAFQHKIWEPRMPLIRELSWPALIICAADGELAALRHLQRGLADPRREFYHGDQRVVQYRKTGEIGAPGSYMAPKLDIPTIHVATEGAYSPSIDEIVQQIQLSASGPNGAASA